MRPWGTPGGLVCHVLLVETPTCLVLVDTGLGLKYADDPASRFGPARFYVRPVFDEAEAAITHVTRLGFDPQDVRHIVLTHFDADHTGGLADFPWAQVHLTAAENFAALHPKGAVERGRYLPSHRRHRPILVEHTPAEGQAWRGFAGAEELADIAPGIVLINLPGHTRGHAAVAIDATDHWVLHMRRLVLPPRPDRRDRQGAHRSHRDGTPHGARLEKGSGQPPPASPSYHERPIRGCSW